MKPFNINYTGLMACLWLSMPFFSPNALAVTPQISGGSYYTCALDGGGAMKCWGANFLGQLGDGTTDEKLSPVLVNGLDSGVVAISALAESNCALTGGGAVKCWGGYDIAAEYKSSPVAVNGLDSGVVAIDNGGDHGCALTGGGAVKCWGANNFGQLGDGSRESKKSAVTVKGLESGVVAITYNCALTNGGAVKCWGSDDYGQLGDGGPIKLGPVFRFKTSPVPVKGLDSGVVAISSGDGHSCALTREGAVKCWGVMGDFWTGTGWRFGSSVPVTVSGLESGVLAISSGGAHNCALISGGAVKCWGLNNYGQLGNGSTDNSATPVAVSGLDSGVVAIGSGGFHSCALKNDGLVKCWGDNGSGQLGNGESGIGADFGPLYSATPVTALLEPLALTTQTLTVIASASGAGTVSSNIGGIACNPDCLASFETGAKLTLTATPASNYSFVGWTGGGCGVANTCDITMDMAKTVSALFAKDNKRTLAVTVKGNGKVTAASINCGKKCSARYKLNSKVKLTAKPKESGALINWGGACTGSEKTCDVTMGVNKEINVTFTH